MNVVPRLLTAREAAVALRLSERTLWAMTTSGEIPHVRIRRRILYDEEELRVWVDRHRQRGVAAPRRD